MFNPQEPHCLTSRTNKSNTIYGMAIYMKSKAALGNDNSIPMTDEQVFYKERYTKILKFK